MSLLEETVHLQDPGCDLVFGERACFDGLAQLTRLVKDSQQRHIDGLVQAVFEGEVGICQTQWRNSFGSESEGGSGECGLVFMDQFEFADGGDGEEVGEEPVGNAVEFDDGLGGHAELNCN